MPSTRNPGVFIPFTSNQNWQEIKEIVSYIPGQKLHDHREFGKRESHDHREFGKRVFKMKLKNIGKDSGPRNKCVEIASDTWVGDSPLYLYFNRLYRLEQNKDCLIVNRISNGQWCWSWSRPDIGVRNTSSLFTLSSEIGNMVLAPVLDSCVWSLASDGVFSVGITHRHIDDHLLPFLDPSNNMGYCLQYTFSPIPYLQLAQNQWEKSPTHSPIPIEVPSWPLPPVSSKIKGRDCIQTSTELHQWPRLILQATTTCNLPRITGKSLLPTPPSQLKCQVGQSHQFQARLKVEIASKQAQNSINGQD
nr:RNA-directed DNA polymerase, eukaryota [Tanacetum cinerariifolium]